MMIDHNQINYLLNYLYSLNSLREEQGQTPEYSEENESLVTYDENGYYHSYNDYPAKIWPSGTKWWCSHGKLHREKDKPAIILSDGSKQWYKNGALHRDNSKPAVSCVDGHREYWENGELVTPKR